MFSRLAQLLEKAVKLEYGDRRQLLLGVPMFLPLAKAPPNNTLRQMPNDRVYLAWYDQTMDILRLLTAAWSRLDGLLSPDHHIGSHLSAICPLGSLLMVLPLFWNSLVLQTSLSGCSA